jgi:DNA-binding transcriptional MerR regulator
MAPESYDLLQLCDLADVTPRTVRYYVQHGLIPSPGTRGPGARYDRGHLDRLQMIKRLQREHLPLAEIRQRLSTLDDDAVAALVREPRRAEPSRDALEYVRDVLAGSTRSAVSAPPRSPRRMAAPARLAEVAAPTAPAQAPAEGAPRSIWERVALSPDVELHVRRPLSRGDNKLVDRLIDHARTLFSEER